MIVCLTEAGRDLRGPVEDVWAKLEARTTGGMSPRQRDDVLRLRLRLLRLVERNLISDQDS